MKGYLKNNILYVGVHSLPKSGCDWILSSAPKLPAIGFSEGHEGVVEYIVRRGIKMGDKIIVIYNWSGEEDFNIAIPVPEKEASTQPVEPDCAGHNKDVAGISDMKALAEIIGDLHYETLGQLFDCISDKLILDAAKDRAADRIKLANHLEAAGNELQFASIQIESAWQISKPHMKPEPTSALPDKQESGNALRNFIDSFVADKSLKYGLACSMVADMARLGIDITDEQQQEYQDKYAEDVVDEILDDMLSKLQSTPSTKDTGQREAIADRNGKVIQAGNHVIYYKTNGGMSSMDIYDYKGELFGAGPFNLLPLKQYAEALDFAGFEIVEKDC